MRKIESVIPEHLRPELAREEMIVPDFSISHEAAANLALLRGAVKQQRKVSFRYVRQDGEPSSRTVHPLGLFYWGKVWTLVAWCELRDAFRHFRLDRIGPMEALADRFESPPGRTLQDFLNTVCDDG
jgi:predicted DNA-binding transcriptional regulator YafY